MKFITLLVISLLSSLSLHAASSIEGDIKLVFEDSGVAANSFKKEFGGVVKATTDWRAGDFFGEETVFAGISVKNTGSNTMYFTYHVAFFDKDKKLVGAIGQGTFGDSGIKPGKEMQLGSCLIKLPKNKYKEIVSYQAVIYETDIAPKRK